MMKNTTLVIMAAGIGSRFGGGIKQLEKMGPNGEIIMDYSIYDAKEAGFNKVVCIIRKDIEKDFKEIIGNRIEKVMDVEYVFQSLEDIPECQLMRLGEDNCELGECCYLGNRINTIDGTVRLHILCRQEEIFSSLMPGREMYRKLGAIFQVYMIDRVRIMLRVRMENTRNADLTLGRLDNPLGISSFLGGLNRRQSQEYELPLAY